MKTLILDLKTLIYCIVTITVFSGSCYSSELMFRDTFFTTDGTLVNDDIYAEGRQSGTVAPLDYTGDGESTDNAIIGDTEKPDTLILENEAYISPNHNFTDLATNFNVEFDLKLNRISGESWAGFGLHLGAEDQHDVMDDTKTGITWWLQKGNINGEYGPVLNKSGGVTAALGNRTRFKNIELKKFEDEYVHVNCVLSTKSFGESDKVTTALFINGEPITAHQRNGTIGYGTVFELNQSFTNNFNIFGFTKDTAVDCNFDVKNYTIRKTVPKITVQDWTNDASSLINDSKVYTHAVNCFGSSVEINGVTFDAASNGSHPYDSQTNWVYMDYNNNYGIGTGSDTTSVSGNGANLLTSFFYSRISSTLMLFNLTPGLQYTLTLYNNSTATGPDSRIVASDSDAGLTVLNQNMGHGNIFRYTYTAPSNGVFSVTFDNSPVDSADAFQNWRLYAFSNEMTVPECSLFMGFLTMAGLFIRRLNN